MYENKSVVYNRPRDCFSCRVISGTGVLGAGLYIGKQALTIRGGYGRGIMLIAATGFGGLGVARLLDLPPFDTFHKNGAPETEAQ